ncbi:hypothetical protein [Nesterenkonia sp. K-15-9-6]|uniref:hypothetical protein n=1 Tax=Nesterenkonia sp. K-15-9-6 TaxID=3093918 RepID=UPI004044BB5D
MAGERAGTARDVARLVDGVALRRRCATSTAQRLLAGAGRLSLVAYREEPQRELAVLAHGMTDVGAWLVVLGSEGTPTAAEGDEADVRLQIDQFGAQADVRVQVASLHALGRVHMLSPDAAHHALTEHAVSDELVAAAAAPFARVAMVQSDSVLVHAREDVEKLPWDQVAQPGAWPLGIEEWSALDTAAALAPEVVARLMEELAHGVRRGILGRTLPAPRELDGSVEQMLLDVDAEGCTWLVREGDQVRAVLIAFDQPVTDAAGFEAALRAWCVQVA